METALEATDSPKKVELAKANHPLVLESYLSWDALDAEWWRAFVQSLSKSSLPQWVLDNNRGELEKQKQRAEQQHQPWWSKLLHNYNSNNNNNHKSSSKKEEFSSKQQVFKQSPSSIDEPETPTSWWQTWLDPSVLQAKPSTLTDLIDKVLTSTPRLLAIANLLLALTYQMHTVVADWFLGAGVYPPPGEWAMTGRERLGSFLVFKLLLISAVVEPDTLDLLILLSWYTLLSFLRSLAHLAAATTSHTTQSGQPPRAGVLQLLLVVLLSDFVAAAVCVALFQPAGVGMVILLTCDCALLAVEVFGHVLKHVRQVLEDLHEHQIADMEEQQVQIHTRQRRLEEQAQEQQRRASTTGDDADRYVVDRVSEMNYSISAPTNDSAAAFNGIAPAREPRAHVPNAENLDLADNLSLDQDSDVDDDGIRTLPRNNQHILMEDSRRLDQSMEKLELAHSRRMAVLDTAIFVLQLLVHAITVGHFLHIWTLHGIQFTLIDGVLALHLHSALSAATKQIAERRNLHRIARNLDGMFPNASELDLKKAHATGDVCCICLGALSVGSVKKVGCGHLYHTNCLREVIERAHSMEAAKCPLCRASVVDGSRPGSNGIGNNVDMAATGENENLGATADANGLTGNHPDNNTPHIGRPNNDGLNHRGERALFRFSTEGILPTWMPLPAFSFEVVRRPTQPRPDIAGNNNAAVGRTAPANNTANNNTRGRNQNNSQQSLFRRLLLLAGAESLSPEEEARALGQLVDMFPQYDRADLLRELRERGSAESVVESVLLGVFSGRVRGSAGGEATPARANNPGANGQHERHEVRGERTT